MELRAAVTAFTNEQEYNTVCFLMYDIKELDGLPEGQKIQTAFNVCNFLDIFPTIEPNARGCPF